MVERDIENIGDSKLKKHQIDKNDNSLGKIEIGILYHEDGTLLLNNQDKINISENKLHREVEIYYQGQKIEVKKLEHIDFCRVTILILFIYQTWILLRYQV
jgi:antitoxin component YwqK of YwqJK toxin-antitoxin module